MDETMALLSFLNKDIGMLRVCYVPSDPTNFEVELNR